MCFIWRPDVPHFGLEVCVDMAVPRDRALDWLRKRGRFDNDDFVWIVGHPRDARLVRERMLAEPSRRRAFEEALTFVPNELQKALRVVA
jgi:hypothetical protein